MTVPGPASVYMVFVLQARGSAETKIIEVKPQTPAAEAGIRARFARVKESWGARHSVIIGLDAR